MHKIKQSRNLEVIGYCIVNLWLRNIIGLICLSTFYLFLAPLLLQKIGRRLTCMLLSLIENNPEGFAI